MTEDVFNRLAEELKSGNNKGLVAVQPYQRACTRMLRIKSGGRCDSEQAYDIFVDAVLDFRNNVLRGRVTYQNLQAYFKRICWYKWLEIRRKHERVIKKTEDVRRSLYEENTGLPSDTENMETIKQQQLDLATQAMQQMTDKCKRILQLAIVDELTMHEIAGILGLANANVAKTTKSRCYKRLIAEVRKLQEYAQ